MRGRVPLAALAAALVTAPLLRQVASTVPDPRSGVFLADGADFSVADAAALDLDQRTLIGRLSLGTDGGLAAAARIYAEGGFSGPCADLTLVDGSIMADIGRGTSLLGSSLGGDDVLLTALEDAAAGSIRLRVRYAVESAAFVGSCRVGGNPAADLSGCLAQSGNIYVGDQRYPYVYSPLEDNYNTRTLAGLGAAARDAHADTPTFKKFLAYYGETDYANEWILAAFGGLPTFFRNGNPDFSRFDQEGRAAAVQWGTVVLNLWMYVMGLVEGAIDDCVACDTPGACNSLPRRALDQARALYTGSQYDKTPDGGYLLFAVAQRGCMRCGTCTSGDGMAAVNAEIFQLYSQAEEHLAEGTCTYMEEHRDRILGLLTVPLVQGILEQTHALDHHEDHQQTIQGQGAAFAAAILPLVDACSQSGALTIYNDLTPGRGTIGSYEVVRFALERNYDCLGITCQDVGGLVDPAGGGYYAGAGPCGAAVTDDDDDFVLPATTSSGGDAAVRPSASSSNDVANTATAESSFESYGSVIGWMEVTALFVVVFGVLVVIALLRKRKQRGQQEEDPAADSTGIALPEVPDLALEKDKAIV